MSEYEQKCLFDHGKSSYDACRVKRWKLMLCFIASKEDQFEAKSFSHTFRILQYFRRLFLISWLNSLILLPRHDLLVEPNYRTGAKIPIISIHFFRPKFETYSLQPEAVKWAVLKLIWFLSTAFLSVLKRAYFWLSSSFVQSFRYDHSYVSGQASSEGLNRPLYLIFWQLWNIRPEVRPPKPVDVVAHVVVG